MADLSTYPVLSVCATTGNKLPDLAIQDGQLIFVRDRKTIALDFHGERTFYRQIEEIATELDRQCFDSPTVGHYYFVIDTASLWAYRESGWKRLTTQPEEIVFIGTELPELGSWSTLYVDTAKDRIAVWDEQVSEYHVVSDKTKEISANDIVALFQ